MIRGETNKSPFKFLDSYSKSDKDIFFGRDNEIEETYTKVFQSKILLVYGASGTGKSSLINCGLANKFNESDWLPIHIRRGGNINMSMFNQINKNASLKLDLPIDEQMSKMGMLKVVNNVYLDHFKPIYLIFDQFEELFVFGTKEEWQAFISTIRFLLDRDLDVHFIFVIRGEYLEFLSEFEPYIPEFFDNRIRLEKMTRAKALDSVSEPARLYSIDIEEGFESRLLDKLSPDKSHIELTFLQVFLDKIYKQAILNQKVDGEKLLFSNSEIDKMGQIGDVLAEFVDEQLFKMDDPKAALIVLKSFVSLKGTKTQMTLEQINQNIVDLGHSFDAPKVNEIIKDFVDKRILKEKDDNEKFELRHDSLALKIYEKISLQEREILDVRQFINYSYQEYLKRKLLLDDEDLQYIAPYEKKLKLERELLEFIKSSKKQSKKRRGKRTVRNITLMVIITLLIFSAIGFILSQREKSKAESLATLAQKESIEANKQKKIAEEQQLLAEKNQLEAINQAKKANESKFLAEKASDEANRQSEIALSQKQLAEKEKDKANRAKQISEQNRIEVLKQKEIAEVERLNALSLRILALSREMAVKSSLMVDKKLKALLGLQAYSFNQRFNGEFNQPDIYNALYSAKKAIFGNNFNMDQTHTQVITDLIGTNNGVYSSSEDGKIKLTNISSIGQISSLTLLESDLIIEKMLIISNLNLMVAGSSKGEIALYDLLTKTQKFRTNALADNVKSIIFDKSNNEITAVSINGNAVKLDLNGNEIKRISLTKQISDAIMVNDKFLFATKKGEIFTTNTDLEWVDSKIPLPNSTITKLGYSDYLAKVVLGYENGQILIWDLNLNEKPIQLIGHTAAITDIVVDNSYIACTSFDRTARVWNTKQLDNQPIVIGDLDSWASSASFMENKKLHIGTYSGKQYIFPIDAKDFTYGLCESIGREMTRDEWKTYVAEDIEYEQICK